MSYDVYFYLKDSSAKTDKDIHQWVRQNILESRYESEDGNFWANPHTGVYFSFEYSVPELDPEDEEEDDEDLEDHYPGFVSTNISFNINYVRADFFGKEAFQVLDEILDATELYYLNPQGEAGLTCKSSNGNLYDEWSRNNESWIRTIVGIGESKYYIPREKTDWIWKYNLELSANRDRMGDDYFVPEISFLLEESTKTPLTFCVWSESIPFILPEVDLVGIYRQRKKFGFKTVEEFGFVPYSEVIEEFGAAFEPYVSHCLILHPDKAAAVEKRFQKFPLDVDSKDRYVGLAASDIINVSPEELAKEGDFVEEKIESEDGSTFTIRRRRKSKNENS